RKRALHAAEGRGRLHQAAELDGPGEIGGADNNKRKNRGHLTVPCGQEGELLLPRHDGEPVSNNIAEPDQEAVPFGALAVEQGDLFGIFAHAHKIESKIGFVTLLLEIKGGEGATDQVCQDSSDDGVNERGPEQVPGDHQGRAEKMQGGASGQIPENYRKGAERYDRVQKTQPDWQDSDSRCAGIDEFPDVLSDALIRVVGGISAQLHAIVIGVGQPSIQIGLREPAPPADLQPLIEIKLINRKHDEDRGEYAKVAELIDEGVPIPVLQRIV